MEGVGQGIEAHQQPGEALAIVQFENLVLGTFAQVGVNEQHPAAVWAMVMARLAQVVDLPSLGRALDISTTLLFGGGQGIQKIGPHNFVRLGDGKRSGGGQAGNGGVDSGFRDSSLF